MRYKAFFSVDMSPNYDITIMVEQNGDVVVRYSNYEDPAILRCVVKSPRSRH